MGILLVIVLVVAVVAGAAYLFNSSQTPDASPIPSVPSTPEVPSSGDIPEPPVAQPGDLDNDPIEQTPIDPAPQEETDETIEDSEADPATEPTEGERPDMNSTQANDGTDDGIKDAYFAKKQYKESGNEVSSVYEYQFNFTQNFTSKTKATVAAEIVSIIQDTLKATQEFAKVDTVASALTAASYVGKNENASIEGERSVSFQIFKMQPDYVRINSAPLESILYVFAKTVNLDEKDLTITIHEKEPLLLEGENPLPVLEVSGADGEEENGAEIIELIETVDDGTFVKKIRLRPESDEDLQEWKDKLAKGKEDGTYNYTFNNENGTTITADNKAELASIIAENANEGKLGNPKIENGKKAYTEDVEENLEEKTYEKGSQITFPIYRKIEGKLWLKASVQGDEESHEEEFLNESDQKQEEGEQETATADNYFVIGKTSEVIFPIKVKPENDSGNKWDEYFWAASQGQNQATYNSYRSQRTRRHAARDLYTNPYETVVAIADGKVLRKASFYLQTDQVTILHETSSGRKFIVRYGELDPGSILVSKDDLVTQGQELGNTGKLLRANGTPLLDWEEGIVYMLHFEYFTGDLGYNLNTSLTTSDMPFKRRTDLEDPLDLLEEGYDATFNEKTTFVGPKEFNENDARNALRVIYDTYGREMAIIIEKMYRMETAHFTSRQYVLTGTGGMEAHGAPPNYGWAGSFFSNYPQYAIQTTTSLMEGVGLSASGGNAQDTTNTKQFIVFPSVEGAMMFKADYIERYNGNYARWFSRDADRQAVYRSNLEGVRPRIVNSF